MKKLFFVVVFALVGFSCFAESIEGWHSYYSSCNAYAGKRYRLGVYTGYKTLKEAESTVDEYVAGLRKGGHKITFVDKPFKNEVKAAFEAVKNHYEPEKGDFYFVMTLMSTTVRGVCIWMERDDSYRYWVYE